MNPFAFPWAEMVILATAATTLGAQEITFTEDDSVFPNPERGFYHYDNLATPSDEIAKMRDRNRTLLWGKIDLEPYRQTANLPRAFLERLEAGFEAAQAAGVKVIVRVSYGHRGPGGDYQTYKDPDVEILRSHIEQLAPVFQRNAERIALFEAGFIGPWGEWHSTAISQSPELRRALFFHLLENTPKSRMVLLRYPALKQSIFQSGEPLTADQAYDGSHLARTGHHNDCFLSSPNDLGTYNRGGLTMQQELTYLTADTLYTLFGGETCALHERSLPDNTIAEMEKLHVTYLNSSYHPEVLQRWRDLGIMETIEKRLGARFVLHSFLLPKTGVAGREVAMTFSLTNRGFASLYNERPVVLVLRDHQGRRVQSFPLSDIDPRRWQPGICVRFAAAVTLPDDLDPGAYSWGLQLPDASSKLADDPRYAIRVANKDIWDAETGEHRLKTDWQVSQ